MIVTFDFFAVCHSSLAQSLMSYCESLRNCETFWSFRKTTFDLYEKGIFESINCWGFFPLVMVCWGFFNSNRMWFERERSQGAGAELSEPATAEIPLCSLKLFWNVLVFYSAWVVLLAAISFLQPPKGKWIVPSGGSPVLQLRFKCGMVCFLLVVFFFSFILSFSLSFFSFKCHIDFPLSLCLMREEIYGLFTSGSLAFPDVLLLWIFETFQSQTINITWLLFSYG